MLYFDLFIHCLLYITKYKSSQLQLALKFKEVNSFANSVNLFCTSVSNKFVKFTILQLFSKSFGKSQYKSAYVVHTQTGGHCLVAGKRRQVA